jgi:hypothetical protein
VAAGTKKLNGAAPQTGNTASAPFSANTDAKAAPEKNEASATANQDRKQEATTETVALKSNAPANTGREAADTSRHTEALVQQSNERQAEASASRRMQPARRRATVPAAAEPEEGWQAFHQYITKNRKVVGDMNSKSAINGTVELGFDVDKNGRPFNIVVTKSLCESCDAEAIRLLKEGPPWKAGSNKATVQIPF